MKMRRTAILFVFLLLTAPLVVIRTAPAETSSVYFGVEPIAIPSLTDTNASINGLETPPTPSPVGQNFTVEIHLVGASAGNVPAGISGVEVHFYFGSILTYAIPTGFTDMTGVASGVLTGPSSKLLYGISAGFYTASGQPVSGPPYTGAVYYEVAAASTATTGWSNADGIVAKITFQIIKQPQSSKGEATAYLPLTCDFTDLTDKNVASVNHDTVQGTLTIDATSAPPITQYSLTVNAVGNGTVTQNPLSTTYASGTNVTLTAVPGAGWTFQGWSGDLAGVLNPANITMNGNKTVTATFMQPGKYYNLTVNVVGNGTVLQSPFNTTYLSGSVVTLTAAPSLNWTFFGWSGDLTGTQSPANITINGNKTVTATFVQVSSASYSLTVNVVGNGTVLQSPFNTTYASNTLVTVTAVAGANWSFSSWAGDVTGAQNPANITMNGNKSVTATFVKIFSATYALTVNIVGNGTVTQNPVNATYISGTNVTLTAVPGANWTFQGWSGDLTGTQNPASMTVDGNKTVTATFVTGTFAGSIDLFTQKTPFSGRGPNQSSDAFQQQELVVLYALVTFSGDPIANKIVAFQVNGPANSLQNMTVTGTGTTNSSGIAEFSFRMPTAPANGQQTIFGEWYAVATVDVDQVQLSDSLTFKVGWIVSIKNIVTLNDKLVPQTSFARLDTVVFNLTVENIALTPRSATITVDAEDVAGNLIIHAELDNLSIPPGESYTQASSQIPETARLGEANVSATAYTAPPSSGGTPYSPSAYTTFDIVAAVYYTLTVNVVGNGSVTEIPSAASYLRNSNVTLTAGPGANWTFQGWSGDATGTQNPSNVMMNGNKIVTATFVQVSLASYTLTVSVVGNGTVTQNPLSTTYASGTIVTLTAVPGASWTFQGWSGDVTGVQNPVNVRMDGNKTVTATFTFVSVGHDVAITAVSVSPSQVRVGENVLIVVVAANLGGYSETFNVTVCYDSNVIQVIPIVSMAPRSSETLTVDWNTTNINPGVYTMSANATVVEGDTNPVNNNFVDGRVTITFAPVPGQLIPYPVILVLFLMGLAILGGVATLMLFVAISIDRRKRKARRTPHYVIVSHPHI
jgi:uncharacterized repeat protein (TIGR02543 family)